jgi:Arc/MetJ family transcription regulator
MGRVAVEIDEEAARRVMMRYGLRTIESAVDLALRRLDLAPMTKAEAIAMQGSGWEASLDDLRGPPRSSDPPQPSG